MSTSYDSPQPPDGTVQIVRETDHVVALCLHGDFDLCNAPVVDATIQDAFGDGVDVIVDLTEATFIDSHIIQVLMRAVGQAQAKNRKFVLQIGTASIVERALDVVRIEDVLPSAHDRQSAMGLITQEDGRGDRAGTSFKGAA